MIFLPIEVHSRHFSQILTIWPFKKGHHIYSDASIVAVCPGCDLWRRARIELLSCSGIASLLSIRTQLLSTAVFDQNWAMYTPSLLKDCTSLFMMAFHFAPSSWSSPLSSASRSTSNSLGRSTNFCISRVTRGLCPLIARIPNWTTDSCRAFLASCCLRQLSWSWPGCLECSVRAQSQSDSSIAAIFNYSIRECC